MAQRAGVLCGRDKHEGDEGGGDDDGGGPYHYGFVVDAVRDSTVTGNRAEGTVHRGVPTLDGHGRLATPPAPFLIDRARASGTFQPEFRDGIVALALWAVQGE